MKTEISEEIVEKASREMFFQDDLAGHHHPGYQPHTWDNIPEIGRINYRTSIRAAIEAVADELLAGAWDEGYEAATYMARCWGHVDGWEDEPANPHRSEETA